MTPELQVIVLVVGVLSLAYFLVLPRLVQGSINRMVILDIVFMVFTMAVVGSKYSGLEVKFTFVFFDTSWWLYTFLTYCVIESPLAFWFLKKYNMKL